MGVSIEQLWCRKCRKVTSHEYYRWTNGSYRGKRCCECQNLTGSEPRPKAENR